MLKTIFIFWTWTPITYIGILLYLPNFEKFFQNVIFFIIEIKEVEVQNCGCTKNILVNKARDSDSKIAFEQTTCSREAFHRGKGQKIIGFSYFRPPTTTLAMFSRIKDYIGG